VWWATLIVVAALPALHFRAPQAPPANPPVVAEPALAAPTVDSAPSAAAVSPAEPLPEAPFRLPARDWPQVALALWGFASAWMLARIVRSYASLRCLKAASLPAPLCPLLSCRRKIRLLVSSRVTTPLAVGFVRPAIVIPASLMERLTEPDLNQIVFHEAAHLARYDDWSNLAQKLIEALFCLHPVVYWIGRRLTLEREIACDDRVVASIGAPRSYAECLARLMEVMLFTRASALATGVAGGKPQISWRIELLLDRSRNFAPALQASRFALALAVLALFAMIAGSAPELIALARGPAAVNVFTDDSARFHNTTVSWSRSFRRVQLRLNGAFDFTDDERDIRSVSPGGIFSIEERNGLFDSRRFQVSADSAGSVSRAYFVNGAKRAFDADGRAWLAAVLQETLRETCIGEESRVRRLAASRGPDAVLSEISLIHSDGCRRRYLDDLIGQGQLNTGQLRAAMRLARQMNSDGDKAALLISVAPVCLRNGLRLEIFDALGTIQSDGDRRRALLAIIAGDPHNAEVLALAAKSAGRMNSDGDKAAVLAAFAGRLDTGEAVRRAWFRAANTINSDGDRRVVLSAALERDGDRRASLVQVLRSVASMNSDGDKRSVLTAAVSGYTGEDPVRRAFFDALNTINSDGDRREVLVELLERPGLTPATLADVAAAVRRMNSDGDRAHVLVSLAAYGDDSPFNAAFFDAA
ncbi:MAG: M56 family metallopeptidase, partial [Bryobacteraceae bacterium]